MKCPKCGYTSFESYDSCKRCSADLTEFKLSHGLTAVVFPSSLRASMAAELSGGSSASDAGDDGSNDMFSFELPTEQAAPAAAPSQPADPFAFNDAPAAASPAFSFDTPSAAPQEDPFAALLETTPQQQKTPPAPQAAPQGFELNSFSWDDTPTPGQSGDAPAGEAKSTDDDFNSLFGDLGGSDKK